MKPILLCSSLALAITASLGAQATPAPAPAPAPAGAAPAAPAAAAPAPAPDPAYMDKVSYFVGTNIGRSFKQDGVEVIAEKLFEGIRDGLAEKKQTELKYTMEELRAAMQRFQAELEAKSQAEMAKQQAEEAKMMAELEASGPKNIEEGTKFFAENGKRAGVTTTASGLQYEVLKNADGPKPKATDVVNVHYHGTLVNGTVFDSSVDRGEPISFPLNRVIPGWTEGVQLMSVGSKYKFFVPAKLAYGAQAQPPRIGPNATLIFEVELLAIENPTGTGN